MLRSMFRCLDVVDVFLYGRLCLPLREVKNIYRPQRSSGKVMFPQCPFMYWADTPLVRQLSPWADTYQLGRYPPGQTPQADSPPVRHPPGQIPSLGRHPLALTPPADPCGQTPPPGYPPGKTTPLPSACWDTHPMPSACWDTHPLPSACWDTPSCHCSRRYASYWNAFLYTLLLNFLLMQSC